MYLFFDVETTGKPKNYKASFKDIDNWPRVTQLAWQLYNSDGKLFKSFSSLIKPNGWTIPTVDELTAQGSEKPNFFVDNNMSTERCEVEGKDLEPILVQFANEINDCKYMLSHNMNFNLTVISCEMYRHNITCINKPTKIFTMQSTTDILQLDGPYGFKWPSLTQLHNYLFGCDFEGAHDAFDDVSATAKCFFELKKRGLLKL